jgi:L-alanine-DL-glutamate epimerase-like enolase superfamily enzyme
LKIQRIVAIPLDLHLRKPMAMAGRRFETLETVLVRLETDSRHVGWGEASVAPYLTGDTLPGVLEALNILDNALRGEDASNLSRVADIVRGALVGNGPAKAAVEVAAHDAAARQLGISVTRLLGGARASRLPVLHLVGSGVPDADVADAQAKLSEGFTAIKYKVANGDLQVEAETMVRLRQVLGDKVLLCADANGGWSRAEARRFVRLADASMADFLEQPVAPEDIEGMAEVARAGRIPVGADEALHAVGDIRRLMEARAASGASFKIMKLGGIRACLDACCIASSLGGEINLSGKVGETSVANAATLAVGAVLGRPSWGLSLTQGYLADDPVMESLASVQGHAVVPDGVGLGIEVDERKVERYARSRS